MIETIRNLTQILFNVSGVFLFSIFGYVLLGDLLSSKKRRLKKEIGELVEEKLKELKEEDSDRLDEPWK